MTIAVGQHAYAVGATTSQTTAGVTTAASGSAFVITVHSKSPAPVAPTSVSDSKSNVYTLRTSDAASGNMWVGIYTCDGGTGGSGHTATVNWSAAVGNGVIYFTEVTGAANPSLDVAAHYTNGSGGTTMAGASLTTTNANDFIISLYGGDSGGSTVTDTGTGFTMLDVPSSSGAVNTGLSVATKAATGTYADSYNISGFDYASFVAIALKAFTATAAALAGAASDTTTAAGNVKTAAKVAGVATTLTSAIAALAGSQAALAGAAATTVTAYGSIVTAIRLAAAAATASTATASLTTGAIAHANPQVGAHTFISGSGALTTAGVTTSASGSTFVITAHSKSPAPVAPATITDNKGNAYTLRAHDGASGNMWVGMYTCDGGVGGTGHTASVTWAAAIGSGILYFTEVTGATSPSLDVGSAYPNNTGGTTMAGSPVTTTNANDLILSLYGGDTSGATVTDTGTGFTILDAPGSSSGAANSALSVANKSTTGTYADSYNVSGFDYASFVTIALMASAGATFAGAASDAITAAGGLSTGIRLAGGATDTTSASSFFPYAALVGAPNDVTSAIGNLTTAIRFASAAASATAAAGTLTSFATVTLAAPLYYGIGGLLDPNFWIDNVPDVGDVVYYDPTYITVATNGEISATTNNCAAVVQFNDGSGWAVGVVVITPAMVGYATDVNTAVGTLNSASNLAGAALSAVTAAAALSTGIQLTAHATDTTTAVGAIFVGLAGAATTASFALGALTTKITMLSSAITTTTAHAGLAGAKAALAGAAIDTTSATAVLSAQILVAGAAADVSTAVGALSTQIYLAAAALTLTTASATVSGTTAPLASAALDVTSAMASFTTSVVLSGAATDLTSATANILLQERFLAAALDVTLGAGQLGTNNASARENILVYLTSQLRTVTGLQVYRSREAAVSRQEGPVLVIQPNEEEVTKLANGLVKRDLSVTITLIIRGNIPDTTADPFLQLIQVAIFTDTTLGGLAALCIEKSNRWEMEIADVNALVVDSDYVVTYMTNTNTVALVH